MTSAPTSTDHAYPAGQAPSPAGHNATGMIDLRSDTVTKPSTAMRDAMASAEVGDDVFGDDPTVNALEERLAALLGKESAVLLTSGTQSNFAGLLAHCARGEEILVGREYHVFGYEARGSSVLGGIALTPLPVATDGALEPADISAAIQPDDPHFPITKLLSLENTVTGRAVPLARQEAAAKAGRDAGLAVHLDGARFFNAAVALGVEPSQLAASADTVSICLSKGLGAPAGSVLCGPRDLISKARRWRKMLGGGMRQAGVIAAAGLHALENHRDGLAEDHARAARLREALGAMRGLTVDTAPGQTNMVMLQVTGPEPSRFVEALGERGLKVLGGARMRLVVHRDLDDADIDRTIDAFNAALAAIG